MLKTTKPVTCMVLFSVACLVSVLQGAFEPWASVFDEGYIHKKTIFR